MKLSKKSRYGLRALVDLCVNSKTEHVALSSIAERNSISPQYLEQVFASLRRAGIIKSVKGPQGGYLLNYDPKEVTVSDILKALDGDYRIDKEDVPQDSNYYGISAGIQTLVIDELNKQLESVLQRVTLADLEKEYLEHTKYTPDMYYI